ncbi:MAG: hypothetical protein LC634_09465, partial [Sphingomonadales bacterium]|nr:hypothetical protein [Sphingomonadales bacterium]
MFIEAGLVDIADDATAMSLKGRLLKDQAKATEGAVRAELFLQSANTYHAASQLAPATYPLINAASLALLGGQADQARQLASDTLQLLDTGGYEPETEYWLAATRAEALLLLDRDDEAQAAMAEAMLKAPQAWEDHAATIGQFALILAEQGKDTGWLDSHRPPKSLHFQGIMGIAPDDDALAARLDKLFGEIAPGFGFGALAAGADILVAEALLRQGAALHIV